MWVLVVSRTLVDIGFMKASSPRSSSIPQLPVWPYRLPLYSKGKKKKKIFKSGATMAHRPPLVLTCHKARPQHVTQHDKTMKDVYRLTIPHRKTVTHSKWPCLGSCVGVNMPNHVQWPKCRHDIFLPTEGPSCWCKKGIHHLLMQERYEHF